MQYLVMQTDDIRTNLATEQYLMNSGKLEAPFMLFYIEKPCSLASARVKPVVAIEVSV